MDNTNNNDEYYNQVLVNNKTGEIKAITLSEVKEIGKTSAFVIEMHTRLKNLKEERDNYKNLCIENGLIEKELTKEELEVEVKNLKKEIDKLKKGLNKNAKRKLNKPDSK